MRKTTQGVPNPNARRAHDRPEDAAGPEPARPGGDLVVVPVPRDVRVGRGEGLEGVRPLAPRAERRGGPARAKDPRLPARAGRRGEARRDRRAARLLGVRERGLREGAGARAEGDRARERPLGARARGEGSRCGDLLPVVRVGAGRGGGARRRDRRSPAHGRRPARRGALPRQGVREARQDRRVARGEGTRPCTRGTQALLSHEREEHLEPLDRADGVGDAGWHAHRLARAREHPRAADGQLDRAVEDLHERVERRGVLRELLAGVEREQRDAPAPRLRDGAAHDGPGRVLELPLEDERAGARELSPRDGGGGKGGTVVRIGSRFHGRCACETLAIGEVPRIRAFRATRHPRVVVSTTEPSVHDRMRVRRAPLLQGTSTAAPRTRPPRRSSSASFARASGYVVTSVRIPAAGASARSSSPSRRVRFATERTVRSPQRSAYGNDGMSLMWMPAQTTVPPGAVARSAAGTSAPTGANRIAASSDSGGVSPDAPAHSSPSERAKAWASASPPRVNAKTRWPAWRASCATTWPAAPNPYRPSRSASRTGAQER